MMTDHDARLSKILSGRSNAVWVRRPEILLCPNVPKPMHGLTPRSILGSEWWDRTRRAAYASTGFHCLACGVHKYQALKHQWLEGHELYVTDYPAGRMTYLVTVPLCHYCHNFIHSGRLEILRDNRQITKREHTQIMRHGRRVLAQAGLKEPSPYSGPTAAWKDWRLVLNGREYPPIHKTYAVWAEFYKLGEAQ